MKTRSLSRKAVAEVTTPRDMRGTRTSKHQPLADGGLDYADPTACDGCGALFTRKSWRRDHSISHSSLERADWAKCPACLLKSSQTAYGRVIITGEINGATRDMMRRRIDNVAARAEHTQPEHRIVSFETIDKGLELLTTSQQLAHRVVHELKKAFGGRATYRWSDSDNSLYATWNPPPRIGPLQ